MFRHPGGPDEFPDPVPDWPVRSVLSVWASGQRAEPTTLRVGGYLTATTTDADRILPGIAAAAITSYTRPGQIVCDPDCGAGTVLVEALRTGRHAVGRPDGRRWWCTARGNVTAAKRAGAHTDGTVLDTDLRVLSGPQTAGIAGRVSLVLTTLRRTRHRQSGPDQRAPSDAGLSRLAAVLARSVPLLHPAGHVIITVPPVRLAGGVLAEAGGGLLATAAAAGLVPIARCVALTAGIRGDRLATRAGLAERRAAARAHAAGRPVCLSAHHDVWIFQPRHLAAAAARPVPTRVRPFGVRAVPPGAPGAAVWDSVGGEAVA